MPTKKEIQSSLNLLIDGLIGRSPFFRFWTPEAIDGNTAKKFLVSFDSLVKSFPSLIALGASRAEDEETRVALAVNLFQESGEGDVTRTHHAIYRKFLETAGIPTSTLAESPFAAEWRSRLFDYLNQESVGAVLGALAAGEFLAQPALGRIYPALKSLFPEADQEYFTKHLQLETEHVEEITAMIARQSEAEGGFGEVLKGFKYALSVWEAYFNHLAEHLHRKTSLATD